MGDIHKFSEHVIDFAERLDGMADAAKGKGTGRGSLTPRWWLILPAAGAGLYALATNGSFARQAKGVMDQAKTRASELPEDLIGRVREAPQKPRSGGGSQSGRRRTTTARRRSTTRKASSSAR
jgi:hypothetical protein